MASFKQNVSRGSIIAIAWISAALATGCGPANDGGGGGGGPVTLEDFPDRYLQAYADTLCEATFGCDDPNPTYVSIVAGYADEADCKANLPSGAFASFVIDTFRPSSENVTFDEDAAGECISAIEGADLCNPTPEDIQLGTQACASILQGTIAPGDACTADDECAGDASCQTGDDPCDGVCVENDPADTSCGDTSCAADQACIIDGEDTSCVDLLSVPEGGACGFQDIVCAPGLECGDDNTCAPYSPLNARGEACNTNIGAQGDLGPCELGLACRVDGGFIGEGTCGDFKAAGETCFTPGECASGLNCLGWEVVISNASPDAPPTCGAPKADGESCMFASECASGGCDEQTCGPQASTPGPSCP